MTTTTKSFGATRPQTAEIKSVFANFVDFAALYRQRRALARLDADALADIGVSADAAKAEAARPVWDVPTGWRA